MLYKFVPIHFLFLFFPFFVWSQPSFFAGELNHSVKRPSYSYARQSSQVSQKLDSIVFFILDSTSQQWKKEHKNFYKYDERGNTSSNVYFQDYSNNQWIEFDLWVKTYDENNKELTREYLTFDRNTRTFVSSFKSKSFYYKDIVEEHRLNKNNNTYEPSSRTTSYYNSNNLKITDTIIDIRNSEGVINFHRCSLYNYDKWGFLTEEIGKNYMDSVWENSYKSSYLNDSIGNMEQTSFTWDRISKSWMPNSGKSVYTYTAEGNLYEIKTYRRNSADIWVLHSIVQYNYDLSTMFDEVFMPDKSPGMMKNKVISTKGVLFKNGVQGDSIKQEAYYSPVIITGIKTPGQGEVLSCFPNPVFDQLYLNSNLAYENYTVSDLSGKILLEGRIKGTASIYCGALSKGIYILKANNKDGVGGIVKFLKE